ncbi:MAG: hypothetical protein IPJ04_13440 [Candidatus Eisenbacteria bacterium]|nr:hypothetical protein [Candidatus Eisenbacteria bacterium]
MKVAAVPPLLFYWGGELTRVALFTPAAMGQRDEIARLWREQRARVLGIALLSPLSIPACPRDAHGSGEPHRARARGRHPDRRVPGRPRAGEGQRRP